MPIQWITDILIGLSYLSIPIGLMLKARSISSRSGRIILILFASFIVFCGGGHLIDAAYLLSGRCSAYSPFRASWNTGTATVSVLTAIVMVRNLHRYLSAALRPLAEADVLARIAKLERHGRTNAS